MPNNPPDYTLAGEYAETVHALALVESTGSPMIGYSDGGQAFGILGQHPSFFVEWYGRGSFLANTKDEWWNASIKAAASFFEHYASMDRDLVVMAYHSGMGFVESGQRDEPYLAKFNAALNRVKAEQNVPS